MAAGENQAQTFIRHAIAHRVVLLGRGVALNHANQLVAPLRETRLTLNSVDGLVPSRTDYPGAGIVRDAFAGPLLDRGCKRLLGGFLGQIEIAQHADEAGDDPSEFLAVELLQHWRSHGRRPNTSLTYRAAIAPSVGYISTFPTGRTSTEP